MYNTPKNRKRLWRRLLVGMIALAVVLVLFNTRQPETIPPANTDYSPELNYFGGETTWYTGYISGMAMGQPFYNREVSYRMVNGLPLLEGDIILDLSSSIMQAGSGINKTTGLWPNGLVPYEIANGFPMQYRVHDAIAHWEEHTSIRFVERTSANAAQYPNYIRFKTSFGCSSYVGMIGGMQPINLANGCSTGNTIHEIGHALGLWHEQSRADRDEYVDVLYENIVPSMAFNFDKHIRDGEDLGPYDYGSIMHYPRWAFSKNGKDTIVPHDANAEIGQRDGLSEGDIAAIEYLYDQVR